MQHGNPNHPVSRAAENLWHKIAALLVFKTGATEAFISTADFERLAARPGGTNITIRFTDTGVHLQLVSDAEAERLAREQGGLPV
jgi:hypothetical protein